MDIFEYISEVNPSEAYQVCQRHGIYQINSASELPMYLQAIVAERGESAFKEILAIHPDKEVIMEVFETKTLQTPVPQCNCMKSADGTQQGASPNITASQTNTYILVGALIVSLAIISMKGN
jgi:hypothetical protein